MYKVKNFPVIHCVKCGFEWRRNVKRELKPSRNCPKCYQYLKIEETDYIWISLGKFGPKDVARASDRKQKAQVTQVPKVTKRVDDGFSSDDIKLLES
jgi:hypothetical protein